MWGLLIGVVVFFMIAGTDMVIWILLFNGLLGLIVFNSDLVEPKRERLGSWIGSVLAGGIVFIVICFFTGLHGGKTGTKAIVYFFIVVGQYGTIKWLDKAHEKSINHDEVRKLKKITRDFSKFCEGYSRNLYMYWNNADNRVEIIMIVFDGKPLKDMYDTSQSQEYEDAFIKCQWGEYEPSDMRYVVEDIIYHGTIEDRDDLEYSTQMIANLYSFYYFLSDVKFDYSNAQCGKDGKSFSIYFK